MGSQGKTLVVAALSVLLLDKRLVRSAWLAIAIMATGITVVHHHPHPQRGTPPPPPPISFWLTSVTVLFEKQGGKG